MTSCCYVGLNRHNSGPNYIAASSKLGQFCSPYVVIVLAALYMIPGSTERIGIPDYASCREHIGYLALLYVRDSSRTTDVASSVMCAD